MYRGTTRKYQHSSKYDIDALHITDRTNAVRLGIKIHLVSMAKDIRGQKLKMAVRPSKCVSFHDFNIVWEVPIPGEKKREWLCVRAVFGILSRAT